VIVFPRDREKGERICQALAKAEGYRPSLHLYEKERIKDALNDFDLLVMVMATGIVVRSICQYLKDKWTDKPVIAIDSSLRYAVPVVGGHHGANDLALLLAERLQLYPAITTATDASGKPSLEGTAKALGAEILNKESSIEVNLAFLSQDVPVLRLKGPKIVVVDDDVAVLRRRGLVVGLGARRGVETEEVIEAIRSALNETGRRMEEVGVLATAWLKRDERGITDAARSLGLEVLYLSPETLNAQIPTTPSRASDLGLAGVAEPAVLALAKRLIMPKKAYGRVTVALGE
jgi:cobalt-precorrin 5A hydrolase